MTEIKKTYKNYVDGKYVRSESGKTYTIELKSESYELPLTSKKDLRDAVTSSKKGFDSWNKLSQYNRTQIIYRLSEMLEGNRDSYVELLVDHGLTKSAANKDIDNAINTIVWYAGLADKWEQLTGNLNPVDGEFFNISHQEPLGVVFTLNSDEVSIDKLIRSFLQSPSELNLVRDKLNLVRVESYDLQLPVLFCIRYARYHFCSYYILIGKFFKNN